MSLLRTWDEMPDTLKNDDVKKYYDLLKTKKIALFLKQLFDIVFSLFLIILLIPVFALVALAVRVTSKGPVIYRQDRVTSYGRIFKIMKFRTMVHNADKMGSLITTQNDERVTSVGKFLRKTRLDEIPQLINILKGEMSFVGTRPEVPKYVDSYEGYMKSTLLMPAGVTSLASIAFKDESKMLHDAEYVDEVYINKVLPLKMKYNLEYIKEFNLLYDIKIIIKTVFAVM